MQPYKNRMMQEITTLEVE